MDDVRSVVQSEPQQGLGVRRGPDRDEALGPSAPAGVLVQAVLLDGCVRRERVHVPGRLGHAPPPLLPAEHGHERDLHRLRPGGRNPFTRAHGVVLDVLHHPFRADGLAPPLDPSLRGVRDDLPRVRSLLPGILPRGLQGAPRVLLDGRDPPDGDDPRDGIHGLPAAVHPALLQRDERRHRPRPPSPDDGSATGSVHLSGRDLAGSPFPDVRRPRPADPPRPGGSPLRPHRAVRIARDRAARHVGPAPASAVHGEGDQGPCPVHAPHPVLHREMDAPLRRVSLRDRGALAVAAPDVSREPHR